MRVIPIIAKKSDKKVRDAGRSQGGSFPPQDSKYLALLAIYGENGMSPEQWNALNDADREKLLELSKAIGTANVAATGSTAGTVPSRDGIMDNFLGAIDDAFNNAFGRASNRWGYVDASGEYRQRICFVAGTLVRTLEGYRPIEDIRVGDLVLAWNENTGELGYRRVTNTFILTARAIWKITYEDGTVVETSWNHPFYIDGRGWVMAKDLRVGDRSITAASIRERAELRDTTLVEVAAGIAPPEAGLLDVQSQRAPPLRITRIDVEEREETVYNFEAEVDHTFLITESSLIVHNSGCGQIFWQIIKTLGKKEAVKGAALITGMIATAACSKNENCRNDVNKALKYVIEGLLEPISVGTSSVKSFSSFRERDFGITDRDFWRWWEQRKQQTGEGNIETEEEARERYRDWVEEGMPRPRTGDRERRKKKEGKRKKK